MKLYELPRNTKFTLKGDESKTEFHLDHLDGIYSLCLTKEGAVVHISADAKVNLVKDVLDDTNISTINKGTKRIIEE
jgi:hypothetical protein